MKRDSEDVKRKNRTDAGVLGRTLGLVAALSVTTIGMTGCRSDMAAVQQAPIVDGNAATDPANANMATPVSGAAGQPAYQAQQPAFDAARAARNGYAPRTLVAGQSYSAQPQAYGQDYSAQDGRQTRSEAYNSNTQPPQAYDASPAGSYGADDDQLYSELLDTSVPLAQQPPPPLPVYEQPVAPGPDYLWTPGYWDYANAGYYYVPGNWVSAPFVGALWTPGWWGYTGRGYGWHRGYWGRHVGYYGGVNYGFGFIGIGYQGGYWNDNHFQYNRDCNHVDPRSVDNYVYQRNVTVANRSYINTSRVSYNGGPGGLQRRPLPAEFAAQREAHIAPLPAQVAERQAASQNRQQFFAANQGRPQQVFAAHPAIERNVRLPRELAQAQQSNRAGVNGQANGFMNGQRGNLNETARPPQGPLQSQQIANQQQQQRAQENAQRLQQNQQNQRQQQVQARSQQDQQRMQSRQMEQGRQQQLQRAQQDQRQAQQQARVQQDQQRTQQEVRHQQEQRGQQQQVRAQQDQQQNQHQQVRQQQDQQRVQQQQVQRTQQEGARQQQQQSRGPQPQRAAPQPAAPQAEHGGGGHEHGR